MDKTEFDKFVLANMPSFIVTNYQRLLDSSNPQEQVALILHIYNLGLRALTINLVSQYVFRDRDRVNYPYLENLLEQKFPHLTPDAWEEMLFTTLKAYEGNRDLFFMPELYDFYWDTSTYPHRNRAEVKVSFDRLTQATLEMQEKRLVPQDESGWKALATELVEHLRKILQSLSFIGKYDLIHVLNQDENFYTFELHKGIHIMIDRKPLPKRTRLTTGWFYLKADTEEFLSLHPLLVFWEDTIEPTDTGVFDRWIYERLRYLLATLGQTRLDEKRVRDFVRLIYSTITEVQREQQETEKLSWVQLCNICEDITSHRVATVQGKYHQELYLQRDKVRQHLETFLADSKKRGFVLVGKSGVGKSNFLLALAEELQARSNVCMLMYDGANLPISSSALTEIIRQDFSDRVFLSRQPVQHIWQEIARIDGIDERQVVVCVDAVNENPQATELLRQLDELIQGPWAWLKIVLSSRPETWKEIKRGVKLAEVLYYQDPGTETLGVELEPFSYSEQMEPFTTQELPEVYSNYQEVFHLQTPYEALSHQVREALRDPLQLWLLAKRYQKQAIPKDVKVSSLIEQYVQEFLGREDRRFLEQQLLQLIVKEGHYSNVITEAELDAAGGALYEQVYSEQLLSDGRRMNQSFLRLCDADILILQEQGFDQQIAFKHERFYEYFAGKRIASLGQTQPDRYTFFLGLIKETTHKPFLWGAVRNALVQEAKRPDSETVLQLCRAAQQRVKEMMVSVLTMLGMDAPEQVEGILKSFMPLEKKATEWRKGQQFLGKLNEASDVATRNAGRIAIEVASTLGFSWVLQLAALQADPTLRTEAVRYSYHLWQHDQARGFEILEYLAAQAVRGFLPNMAALESALGLSVVIFFDHYQDKSVLRRLQSIWRGIIAKLLRIQEGSNPRGGVARTFIREQLISLVSRVAFWIMDNLPGYNPVSYKQLERFFQLGHIEKSLYRNLIRYIDVDVEFPEEQMERDYLAAIRIDVLLFVIVFDLSMVPRACRAPVATLPLLRKLFDAAQSDVVTYPSMGDITKVLECVLDHDSMRDEVFEFFVEALETSQEIYTNYPQCIRNRLSEAPKATYLGAYIHHQYQRTGTVRNDEWLKIRIDEALARADLSFFELLLEIEMPFVAIEWQRPQAALEVLAMFFQRSLDKPLERDNKNILQIIIAFLARLRIRYPDEVDDFLEVEQTPDKFRLQVQTNEPVETIGALIGQNAWYFIRDEVLLKSPELRSQLIQVFDKAAECKNLRAWLDYFIRQIVNQIYGGEALRQSAQ